MMRYSAFSRAIPPLATIPLLLGGLSLATGCDSSVGPTLTTWEGDLAPVFPNTVTGQVAAVTQFGRTNASIQILEADPELDYGWRINLGTCEQEGLIRGGVAVYEPLYPGELGRAEGDAVMDVVFGDGAQLAARVYTSDGGSGETVVACGELEQTR